MAARRKRSCGASQFPLHIARGQCPSISPRQEDPQGVPLDAIFFGARRARAPLIARAGLGSTAFIWAQRSLPKPPPQPQALRVLSVAIPWPCCPSSAITSAIISRGWVLWDGGWAPSAEDFSRELVSQRASNAKIPVARLRRKFAAATVGAGPLRRRKTEAHETAMGFVLTPPTFNAKDFI